MLTIEDIEREVRVAYANHFEFCDARRGMSSCDRAHGHNGRHAQAYGLVLDPVKQELVATKLSTWK